MVIGAFPRYGDCAMVLPLIVLKYVVMKFTNMGVDITFIVDHKNI